MLTLFICGVGAALLFIFLTKTDPLPLNSVYSVPGKWYLLKFHFMKFMIGHRQKKTKTEKVKSDNLMNSQFGGNGKRTDAELDCKHDLPVEKDRPIDAVFFDASNRDGWYFTCGTAQRKDDIINLFFILRIPGVGTYVNEEMYTDGNVKSVPSKTEWITESGFRVRCEEPMKRWRLSFKGRLAYSPGERVLMTVGPDVPDHPIESFPAEFDLTWNNFGEYFDFDTEVSPTAIGHSLAIEKWSRELFDKLRASHQTHYEQFGFLTGYFNINGTEYKDIRMTSMRDHTISGHRNWSELRRYIMMIFHLEDGTCMHASLINMPETVFSHLEFGYVILPDKRNVAVDRIHLHLSNIGENKKIPPQFNYSFTAGGEEYNVKVKIIETTSFKMGNDLACQVNENMCEYEVNGVRGWGFAEFEYRIEPY